MVTEENLKTYLIQYIKIDGSTQQLRDFRSKDSCRNTVAECSSRVIFM